MEYKIDRNNLKIIISGNPTTGYSKEVSKYDHNVLEYINSEYVNDNRNNLLGYGGKYIFSFRIKNFKDKKTNIEISNGRPWLPSSYTYTIYTINF